VTNNDLTDVKNDIADVRSEVKSLRADVVSDLITMESRLSGRIAQLNRAVMEYQSSTVRIPHPNTVIPAQAGNQL
jgi:hypothetical protein